MERFNILRNYVGFYHSVGVAAAYTTPGSLLHSFGSVANLVYASLAEIVSKQPILGVTLEDEGTPEPRWVRLETIDFRKIVKIVDGDPRSNLEVYLQDFYRAPFKTYKELPLWRVIVVNSPESAKDADHGSVSFTIGFFCHHGVGDGLSAGAFHLHFRDVLSDLLTGKGRLLAADPVMTVPKKPLLPNLEMKTAFPLSIWYILKEVITNLVYSSEDPLHWAGPRIDANTPRPPLSNLRNIFLPHSIVSRLVSKCRDQRTTFTCLVNILIARKLSVMYPSYSRFTSSIPISLRKFTQHTNRDMGCYVSECTPYFSSEPNPPSGYISCRTNPADHDSQDKALWESSRICRSFIDAASASTKDTPVGLLKFVAKDYPKFFLGKIGKQRVSSFEVTNIGVLDGGLSETGGVQGKATFDRVVFSSGTRTYGPPYNFHLATAKNGDLCINLTWEVDVVKDQDAQESLRWLETELKSLAKS